MNKKSIEKLVGRKLLGSFGVDSGQVLIIDPCYLHLWKDNEFVEGKGTNDLSYNGACNATIGYGKQGGSLSNGKNNHMAVVSSTGFGDGCYDVYATYEDTGGGDIRVAKLEIIFL